MTATLRPSDSRTPLRHRVPHAAATPAGFSGVFGKIADAYFQRYGDKSDALARIAAKNHKNGVDNPYAQMRKDLGFEFCRAVSDKNPYVAGPLKRTDCSLVSDGAAALVLADLDTALASDRAVLIRSVAQVNDFLPMRARDIVQFAGHAQAFGIAGTVGHQRPRGQQIGVDAQQRIPR
mgnify:CR=1 FL=1